jgi:hypothetical protein
VIVMSINAISGIANAGVLSQSRLFITKPTPPSFKGDVVQTARDIGLRNVRRSPEPTLNGDIVQTGTRRSPEADTTGLAREAVQALHNLQALAKGGNRSDEGLRSAIASFTEAFNNLAAATGDNQDASKFTTLQSRLNEAFQDTLASINAGSGNVEPPRGAIILTKDSDPSVQIDAAAISKSAPKVETAASSPAGALHARVVDLVV